MAAWTAERVNIRTDPRNFAVLVDIVYTSDDGRVDKETREIPPDVPAAQADAYIAEITRLRISGVFKPRDALLAQLGWTKDGPNNTKVAITLPPAPKVPNPDPVLVADAGAKFKAFNEAQVRALVSPNDADKQAAVDAWDAYLTAKNAADASATQSGEGG